MDAQFWGVAQRRKRIFLVADFAGRSAPQILFEQNRLPGYSASSGGQRQGTAASAPGCSDPPGGTGPIGFDGYNGDLTGEKAATLGVNCGMSTGRNGVLTAFAANQRDEVRDLHDVAAALTAQPGMKQQTFVAGITAKGNGDCFLSEERHTALSGGGGMPGQGYPAIFTAAFSAGAGASAGSIGYGEEVSPTLKGTASGNCMPSCALMTRAEAPLPAAKMLPEHFGHRSMATSHLYSRTTGSMPATPAHILWRPQCQPVTVRVGTMSRWSQNRTRYSVSPEMPLTGSL